jgi:hypothetical protein
MRTLKSLLPALVLASLFSALSYAEAPDRITSPIDSSQVVPLYGNVHGLTRPGSDLGRADGSRVIRGVSLNFRLSAAQQKDLGQFLAQLGDRSSPNYHKYLTIPQYAKRFGMSQNDLNKVVAWIQSQGLTNIKVAPNRNKISFDGTVAQVESLFALEMHNYLVDGDVHLANAMNPSLPAALAGAVLHVGHLNDFVPKPRLKVKSNLTSYISGNHFLTPGDFATIYDLNPLYSAGATGSNQTIAIVGQSTVSTTDLNNFRSAAGLPASIVTMKLIEGTATRCTGDEGESDLDLEWSGGVAKNASITFIYAGLDLTATPPDTCASRFFSVWDALEDALTGTTTGAAGSPIAPFVSTSYGYCEQGLQSKDPGFVAAIQGWVQTGQTLGVTLVSASGDAGAADCDSSSSKSATMGLAVDVPASIPETTGAGGNEFSADSPTYTTDNPPGGDQPYWAAAGTNTDTISSALEYIPETGWNDTVFNINNGGGLGASGGGASTIFAKPTWQTGTGVPPDSKRDVPDIALSASADHDPYLFCSEDGPGDTIVQTCTEGFRTGSGGNLTAVGGTSTVAPTFSAILSLINQYLNNTPPTGLAPINPTLYSLYVNNSTSKAFHDVTTGNNMVPCTTGTPNCPSGTTEIGFSAGVGYDQVTGLGSVDGFNLAQAWAATVAEFTLAPSPAALTAVAGQSSNSTTITVTPLNGFTGTVTFTCSSGLPAGATCVFTPVNSTSSTLVISQIPANTAPANNIVVTVKGTSGAFSSTTTVSLTISATTQTFSLTSSLNGGTLTVSQGATSGPVNLTVTSSTGFIVTSGSSSTTSLPVTYSCSGLPTAANCIFSPGGTSSITSSATSVSLTISTLAPTAALRPSGRGMRIFYAALLPGLFGIMFTLGSRKRSLRGLRLLGLIMVLGFSTLWLGSCGGTSSSGNSNPGTPVGSYTLTVNATTGGAAPIAATSTVSLTVTAN